MSIDILHTSSDSFRPRGGYIALKDRDKVECFLKQSLNGAILLEGCQGPAAGEGKHRGCGIDLCQRLSHSQPSPRRSSASRQTWLYAGLKCSTPERGGGISWHPDCKRWRRVRVCGESRVCFFIYFLGRTWKHERFLLVCHLLVVFTAQLQQLCLRSVQCWERQTAGSEILTFRKHTNFDLKATRRLDLLVWFEAIFPAKLRHKESWSSQRVYRWDYAST